VSAPRLRGEIVWAVVPYVPQAPFRVWLGDGQPVATIADATTYARQARRSGLYPEQTFLVEGKLRPVVMLPRAVGALDDSEMRVIGQRLAEHLDIDLPLKSIASASSMARRRSATAASRRDRSPAPDRATRRSSWFWWSWRRVLRAPDRTADEPRRVRGSDRSARQDHRVMAKRRREAEQQHGQSSRVYVPILREIVRRGYVEGSHRVEFTVRDVRQVATDLGLEIGNAPDLIYRMRARTRLPDDILDLGFTILRGIGRRPVRA